MTIGSLVHQWSKTVRNSQKTVKTANMTIGVPIVTFYQDCTNSVPIVKNSQKSVKTENMTDHWCTNFHRSTKTLPTVYQQCTKKTVKRQLKQQKNIGVPIVICLHRVRRIHKATGSTVIGSMTPRNENGSVFYRLHVVDRRLKCTHVVVRLRSTYVQRTTRL